MTCNIADELSSDCLKNAGVVYVVKFMRLFVHMFCCDFCVSVGDGAKQTVAQYDKCKFITT